MAMASSLSLGWREPSAPAPSTHHSQSHAPGRAASSCSRTCTSPPTTDRTHTFTCVNARRRAATSSTGPSQWHSRSSCFRGSPQRHTPICMRAWNQHIPRSRFYQQTQQFRQCMHSQLQMQLSGLCVHVHARAAEGQGAAQSGAHRQRCQRPRGRRPAARRGRTSAARRCSRGARRSCRGARPV